MYLNAIYYGNGYLGLPERGPGLLRRRSRQADWAEASLLAGLPQAPSDYDPVLHFGLAKQRQLQVLDQLVANHVLTTVQARAAYKAPLPLRR